MPRARWLDSLEASLRRFRRVVVWGHLPGTHTHSYVHAGFVRAFRSLGVETVWTHDRSALEALGLDNSLVFTEGQVMNELPKDPSCRYVLHNVALSWYEDIASQVLALQVHTLDTDTFVGERINPYTFVATDSSDVVTLHQPWATDLLPKELDFSVAAPAWRDDAYVAWVGTIGQGEFGNEDELAGFRHACAAKSVKFVHKEGIDLPDHRRLVAGSLMAPAIVGAWQLQKGYLPCRIFKNISYGRMGLTNSPPVAAIFDEEVPCCLDSEELFSLGVDLMAHGELVARQMREVRDKHTFLNRIEVILRYLP